MERRRTKLKIAVAGKGGVELKEEEMEEIVLDGIAKAGIKERIIISSFYHASLHKIKELSPEMKTGVIISSLPVFPVKIAIDARVNVIFPKFPRLNRNFVAEALKKGIEIYPWTINTKEDLEKSLELGVEGVVTDNISFLVKVLSLEKKESL